MADYIFGKIYKIVSDHTDQIYIGYTTEKNVSCAMTLHRESLKKKNVSSSEIMKYGDAKIILLEYWPYESKDELRERVQYFIDQNREICINVRKSFQTEEEKKQKKRQSDRELGKCRKPCIYCGKLVSHRNFSHHCKTKKHESQVEFFEELFKNLEEEEED